MNRFASPGVDARMGERLPQWGLRLLSLLVAAGLTAALWLGAGAESSRHHVVASPRATTYVTLPMVVVTAHRAGETPLRSQVVARTAPDCASASEN
jgi:hypothetical protein